MNINNQMYKMFKTMKQGYRDNNQDAIEQGARCWLELKPENPFPEDSPEYEAFFQMQKSYTIWKRGDVNRKINRRRMVMWANKLCSLNPKQPYKFDKKAEEEEEAKRKAEEEAIRTREEEKKAKILADKAMLIVQEEQRKKQAELKKQLMKAEGEAEALEEFAEKKALEEAIEKEREKYINVHFEEESQLEALLKKNEEEKARLLNERDKIQKPVEPENIVKPQVVLGVLPEKKKGFFARLFKR